MRNDSAKFTLGFRPINIKKNSKKFLLVVYQNLVFKVKTNFYPFKGYESK